MDQSDGAVKLHLEGVCWARQCTVQMDNRKTSQSCYGAVTEQEGCACKIRSANGMFRKRLRESTCRCHAMEDKMRRPS